MAKTMRLPCPPREGEAFPRREGVRCRRGFLLRRMPFHALSYLVRACLDLRFEASFALHAFFAFSAVNEATQQAQISRCVLGLAVVCRNLVRFFLAFVRVAVYRRPIASSMSLVVIPPYRET